MAGSMNEQWDDQVECASVQGMIAAVKARYKADGGTVVSADDPMEMTIGYAVGRTRWYMQASSASLSTVGDETRVFYGAFISSKSGRAQLAKLIMTAARSEPPPPMQDEEE